MNNLKSQEIQIVFLISETRTTILSVHIRFAIKVYCSQKKKEENIGLSVRSVLNRIRKTCTPLNPTFIQQNWDMCVHLCFLIFDPKHALWVLVRTASATRFQRVPTMYVSSENS